MAGNSAVAVEGKKRRGLGRPFRPGESGNPDGRPKLPTELKLLCQGLAPEAIRVAAQLLNDSEQPGNVRLKAAEVILDRGYGKPAQAVEVNWHEATPEQRADRLAGLLAVISERATGVDNHTGDRGRRVPS